MDNSQIEQTENVARLSLAASAGARLERTQVNGWFFLLFAVELFLLGMVLWSFLVNRHSFPNSSSNITDLIWGLIGIAAAGWGTWYWILSRQAAGLRHVDHSRNLLAISVASGAILLGILLLNIARVFVAAPVYMDMRPQFAVDLKDSKGGPAAESAVAAIGDPENGKKWFGMTCVSCHGATGDGVLNAAPSLRTSEFLKTADVAAIASLIRLGRAANDPANKTGKVMPAKGGNPFLDESKIADLAAFLDDLETQMPPTSNAGFLSVPDAISGHVANPNEPPPIVRNWKLEDFAGLDVTPTEESVSMGMQAFMKAACNQCHMAAVAGRELGPTLDQIAKKYERKELAKHMVDPSLEINEKFKSRSFELFDGRTITGIVVAETDQQLSVMTDMLKPDKLEIVLVDDIEDEFEATFSPMPTGLLDVLTQEEIEGLVAYIDVVGKQMGAPPSVPLAHWVVPDAASEETPTNLATSRSNGANSQRSMTFASSLQSRDGRRYQFTFSWLFLVATSVLAIHFLWVVGSGTAIVLHRELKLSSGTQIRMAQQTFLFWLVGLVWLLMWFVVFFLIG